jgi:N-acetylneuraminic acid mutarotase/uncharacterized GH25 family protein
MMNRFYYPLVALFVSVVPVRAHFIWIVPDRADTAKATVIFSEDLKPDEAVPVEKIAAAKLFTLDAAGKTIPLDWKKDDHAYQVRVPDTGVVLGGVCRYGVLQRGEGKPFLLAYYPKFIRGEIQDAKPCRQLLLEIVPRGKGRFQVFFAGKPAADDEVIVLSPAADSKESLKTDAQGEFKFQTTVPGLYGIRVRHIEAKSGEHIGKRYDEARHYATLVFHVTEEHPNEKRAESAEYAPLPRAISSFGAAVVDDWVYVYGGHCGKAHVYSTEDVLGTFHRLHLKNGKKWEDLPGGPALQGLAMVSDRGKLYRIGGMQATNKPSEKPDNRSLNTCACYDPANKTWEALPALPEGRSSHDAVIVGEELYVVGGWRMNGSNGKPDWHNTMLVLDLSKKPMKWQSIEQPFHRRALTAACLDDKLYVIAGLTDKMETTRAVNIYDAARRSWSRGPDIPEPNSNGFAPASCVAGGRLYVSTADGKLHRLSEKGDGWETVGMLKQPRYVHRMVAVSPHLLLVIGGASKSGNVALTEAIGP